jgi:hypothetical protein
MSSCGAAQMLKLINVLLKHHPYLSNFVRHVNRPVNLLSSEAIVLSRTQYDSKNAVPTGHRLGTQDTKAFHCSNKACA